MCGKENWECHYDSFSFEGIFAIKRSYAISYGQIMRELSSNEYHELVNQYYEKLCELDLQYIESKIEKNEK